MTHPLGRLRIGTRLLLIVLVMMLLTLTTSYLVYAHFEATLLDQIQDQTESLSKALQISVQQLTARGMTDDRLLDDYVQRLSSRGVKEISILSNEKRVVASSDRGKIGTQAAPPRLTRRGHHVVITGILGDDDAAMDPGHVDYTLDIPIIVDDEKRGYVRLHLLLDDFDALIREAMIRRLLATAAVFVVGLAGVAALSYRMTRDLDRLSVAARQVTEGSLPPPIASGRGDEVGGLIGAFNRMVERLREQRALEARLRQAERTSAVGRLAAAVAHEIRNPLNLISLSVDHLGEAHRPAEAASGAEFQRIIGTVRSELTRLNRLVGDFLSYGRPPRLALRACRVEALLGEVLALTEEPRRVQGIVIERRLEEGLPPVCADPDGLRTCFLNVVVNAIQAMPAGGRLTVEAQRGRSETGEPVAVVTIDDSGAGIAPADLERIFDPYFSTREAGVGLGLAITQRIVQEHGGTIRVASRPGRGTSFRIEIPERGPGGTTATRDAA